MVNLVYFWRTYEYTLFFDVLDNRNRLNAIKVFWNTIFFKKCTVCVIRTRLPNFERPIQNCPTSFNVLHTTRI